MLRFINYTHKNSLKNLEILLNKRKSTQKNQTATVTKIIFNVKKKGDKAVLNFEKKFSKIKTKTKKIVFTKKEINEIIKTTDNRVKKSIDLAYNRIKKFLFFKGILVFSQFYWYYVD